MDRDEYIKRERAADDEHRRKLEEQNKKAQPVIEEARSTHEKEAEKQPKVDRFAGVKKSFREQGERFKRGWKASREELKEGASYKVREKLGKLTPDEKSEKLKQLRQNLSIEKTEAAIERVRASRASARRNNSSHNDVMNFGMTDPGQWYGIQSSGKDTGPVSFSMDAYENLFLNRNAGKRSSPAGLGNAGIKGGWNGNILRLPGVSSGAVGPDLKKVRAFYGI